MIVADTDVLIDALRGRDPSAARVALELRSGSLATTTVTAFELLSGVRSAGARSGVEQLLAAMTLLGLDATAAAEAAAVRQELETQGAPIGMADYLIVGICLANSAVLLTRDRERFERVPGLRIGRLTP